MRTRVSDRNVKSLVSQLRTRASREFLGRYFHAVFSEQIFENHSVALDRLFAYDQFLSQIVAACDETIILFLKLFYRVPECQFSRPDLRLRRNPQRIKVVLQFRGTHSFRLQLRLQRLKVTLRITKTLRQRRHDARGATDFFRRFEKIG